MTEENDRNRPSASTLAASPTVRPRARNFWILVAYQVVLRAGWIFKTESVVMPHAADALDPTGLARGWLPLFNRLGQSVPPVLAARRVKNLPKKKRAFIATTASMTLCFLGLTSLWLIPGAAQTFAGAGDLSGSVCPVLRGDRRQPARLQHDPGQADPPDTPRPAADDRRFRRRHVGR